MVSKRNKTILVTGATGFVGRHTVKRLLDEKNIEVRCLVREHSDIAYLKTFGRRVSFVEGDITDLDSLAESMGDIWGVVNLAGYR